MATRYGTRGSNSLSATSYYTELHGLDGNDTLRSNTIAGVSLYGENGNDALYAKGTDLLIDGGDGIDTAYFAAAVSLSGDGVLVDVENIVITNSTTDASYDFGAESENLNITGNRRADAIMGGSGDDTITGGLGADNLVGGAGNDLLVAEGKDAKIDGGDDVDTVRFAAAVKAGDLLDDDLVNVENVVITATAAGQYDFGMQSEALNITGSRFAETISGGTGADTLDGGAGNDRLVAASSDTVNGGAGTDTVVYGASVSGLSDAALAGIEKVVIANTDEAGGSYDFSSQGALEGLDITGTVHADSIQGGSGADTITGDAGADTLDGDDGNDLIVADASDSVDGGDGLDVVRYAAGFNELADAALSRVEQVLIVSSANAAYDFGAQSESLDIRGNNGSDTITGGSGADTLYGGAGNDWLLAADTDALIDGGSGVDTVQFAAAVTQANLADADLVNVEKVEITNEGGAAYDFGAQTEGLTITGSSGNDSILGSSHADSIRGGNGDDSLTGNAGADTLLGGDGDDTLVAEDGDARIDGGAGNDTVVFRAAVSANKLTDSRLLGVEKVVIDSASTASYDFSAQAEALSVTGSDVADGITGTRSADSLDGGAGSDTLKGGAGADTIVGGAGADVIDGGAGADIFVYRSADESHVGNGDATSIQAAGIDKVTIGTGDKFDFDGLSVALTTTSPIAKIVADSAGQLTADGFMAAIADVITGAGAYLVKVTDQDIQAGADGSFSGTYLIATEDGTLDGNDYVVQLVGVSNVTATGASGGDIVVT